MVAIATVRGRLQPYLPRLTLEWLATDPARLHRSVDGSLVFVDISGFTALSERLAALGRVGAEEMAEAINVCFTELLALAYREDGSLLKFGGDALLLLFTGDTAEEHARRAARAAIGMRKRLREVGTIETPKGRVRLRMSVGAHTGRFDFFLVGGSHRELVVTGPAATEVVRMEGAAEAGQILASPATAALLPSSSIGAPSGPGALLKQGPGGASPELISAIPDVQDDLLEGSIPIATRDSLLAGTTDPEHRQVSIAFVHFDGTDEFIERFGSDALAAELDRLVRDTQAAVDELGACFLGSDVDADGGKLILTAGAPRAVGGDEERLLLAARRIVEADRALPVRVGVNQGAVFAGDIGPDYRRTYTVMGDAVNLAARLMAKAPPGELYASGAVLERSATRFETAELEPFHVKGKKRPVRAWSVGPPIHRPEHTAAEEFPIHGRQAELAVLREAEAAAREGLRRTVVLEGEAGIGKTRLLDDLLTRCQDFTVTSATGEVYTASTPYVTWRDMLRELIGVEWEAPAEPVVARIRELMDAHAPELLPWLPLVATAADADADAETTPEVRDLGAEFRRPKLHQSVVAFLRAILPAPTLFVFEDAHLMDEASADLLRAVATSEATDAPWVLVVLRRPGVEGAAIPDHEGITTLELGPLDAETTTALAQTATDEAPLPGHVLEMAVERSQGNPQLLLDLIHAARSGGGALPDSVEAAATVRIDGLMPHDRTLVRRVSVFGLAFHPRVLDDVLEEDTPRPDEATWERLSEIFEPEAEGYLRFRRAVIRDAAYSSLPFRTRKRLHAVVGRRFEQEASDPNEIAGLLSLHFFLAGIHEKAWQYSNAAAAHASSIYANVEAARLYARAVEAGRKSNVSQQLLCEAIEALGDARWAARLYADARKAYADVATLIDNDVDRACLMVKRSQIEQAMGRLPQALRWLSRGRSLLAPIESPDALRARAEIEARYALVLQNEGRSGEAVRVATQAVEIAESAGSSAAAAEAENTLGTAMGILGLPGSVEHLERALGHFEDENDLNGQAMILGNLGVGSYFEGRWADALELYQRALETSRRQGDPFGVATNQMNLAEILIDQGQLTEAEPLLRDASRTLRATEEHFTLGFCLTQLGRIAMLEGRLDEAASLYEQARDEYRFVGAPAMIADVDARDAERLLLCGDSARVLDLTDATLEAVEGTEGVNALLPILARVRGYALLQLGRPDEAELAFERSVSAAEERGADHEAALSLQGLARLARSRGLDARGYDRRSSATFERLEILAVPAYPVVF